MCYFYICHQLDQHSSLFMVSSIVNVFCTSLLKGMNRCYVFCLMSLCVQPPQGPVVFFFPAAYQLSFPLCASSSDSFLWQMCDQTKLSSRTPSHALSLWAISCCAQANLSMCWMANSFCIAHASQSWHVRQIIHRMFVTKPFTMMREVITITSVIVTDLGSYMCCVCACVCVSVRIVLPGKVRMSWSWHVGSWRESNRRFITRAVGRHTTSCCSKDHYRCNVVVGDR